MTSVSDPAYVMVFGTRTLSDQDLVTETLDKFCTHLHPICLMTGEWRGIGYGTPNYLGADLLAERWAHRRHYATRRFPPVFEQFPNTRAGRAEAMLARNREMVEFLDEQENGYAVAFWDGESSGTAHVLGLLKKFGIPPKIVRY